MGITIWTLQSVTGRKVFIHVDANSVVYAASGQWNHHPEDHLLRRVRALYQLLSTLIGDNLQARHIKAHSGRAGNELADLLAKHVREHPHHARVPQINLSRWMHGEPPLIEWAWAYIETEKFHFSPTSTYAGRTGSLLNHNDNGYRTSTPRTRRSRPLQSTCIYLRGQLHQHGVHLAGLQETRTSMDNIPDSDYYRFVAIADHGVGGCELYGPHATYPICANRTGTCILTKRTLPGHHCGTPNSDRGGRHGDLQLLLCVAHAPNSGHGKTAIIATWWGRLHTITIIGAAVNGRSMIMFICKHTTTSG